MDRHSTDTPTLQCDGKSPTCERCARLRVDCVYSESGRDKRLDRRTEQRANLDLRNRVRELEAQLAAATGGPQSRSVGESGGEGDPEDGERGDHLRPGNNVSLDANSEDPSRAASAHESPVDVLAAGVFDHPSSGYMCYFGEYRAGKMSILGPDQSHQGLPRTTPCSGRSRPVLPIWVIAAATFTRSLCGRDVTTVARHSCPYHRPPLSRLITTRTQINR